MGAALSGDLGVFFWGTESMACRQTQWCEESRRQGEGNRDKATGTRRKGQGDREKATGRRRQRQGDRDKATGTRRQGQGDRDKATGTRRQGQGADIDCPGKQSKRRHRNLSRVSYRGVC